MHGARLAGWHRSHGGAVVDVPGQTSDEAFPSGSVVAGPAIVWPARSLPAELAPGAAHVWGWAIKDAAIAHSQDAVLSPEERTRADRFVAPIHRTRFVTAHAGMRRILSGYLGVDPAALAFEEGSHGKPRLTSHSGLEFNLSHAQDVALLAVGTVELGVDVEFIHPVNDAIAERFFAPDEIAALAALPEGDRLNGFFACWTRKEAFLKGVGTGISGGLDSFSVTLAGQETGNVRPTLSDASSGITAGWSLEHLGPAPGYIGALAVRANTVAVECFSFSF
jgi:4'-phosphopantetheinyl transferase